MSLYKNLVFLFILSLTFIYSFYDVCAQETVIIADGYKIKLPENFKMDKALSYPGSVLYSDKKCNISLTSQRTSNKSDLKSSLDNVVNQLKLSGFKINKTEMREQGQYPLFLIISSLNNGKIVNYQYGILAEKTIYMITCSTTAKLIKEYEPVFENMIKTFSK